MPASAPVPNIPLLIKQALSSVEVTSLLAALPAQTEPLLALSAAIQQIPAPTFEEKPRSDYVKERLAALELKDIEQDDLHNVMARLPGADRGRPAVLVSAHLDTVFTRSTHLNLRRTESPRRLYGPGIGDNSLGLAGMLMLAQALSESRTPLASDIWFAATVGEEGLGDLRGIKRVCQRLQDQIGAAIIIEGMGYGRIVHAGLGVRRLKIEVSGPGGHSWLHHKRPSAIHHLMRIGGALVDQIALPDKPRTTFNIGLVDGGTSINTRAAQASLSMDLRSEDAASLRNLEEDVMSIVRSIPRSTGLKIVTHLIGDRPAAALPAAHPLVQMALAVLRQTGMKRPILEIGSTDANAPLALGIPAVCIGITTGGDAHSLSEYIDIPPLEAGMRQLTLLAWLAANSLFP
jgi:acetylornithine deacetylase/succinyl-diaminopimelate desuccinylase-like protein